MPLLRENASLKKLSWFLPQIQYVDFRRNYDQACRQLLQNWNKRYRA